MQDKITKHIIDTYNPDVIILHGSRARKKERAQSDWDIVLLFSQQTEVRSGRELFDGQNIEYSVQVLPVEDIFGTFDTKLQGAVVLFEKDSLGSSLLREASDYYAQGVHWSKEKMDAHKLWIEGRIQGMSDCVDNPPLFHKYFSDFYDRIYNYWYWLTQYTHSQPIYIAIEEIVEKDPVFHELLVALFADNVSRREQADICFRISQHLFKLK